MSQLSSCKQNYNNGESLSVVPTPVSGVISEITMGTKVFYQSESGHLIFGEIFDPDGNSITASAVERTIPLRVEHIASNKNAVRRGRGDVRILEVSDPSCPFCRNLHKYLSTRTNISRWIFFSTRPQSRCDMLARRIVLDPTIFDDVYDGLLDNTPYVDIPIAAKRMSAHRLASNFFGHKAVPSLFVGRKYVSGLDIGAIEAAIEAEEELLLSQIPS